MLHRTNAEGRLRKTTVDPSQGRPRGDPKQEPRKALKSSVHCPRFDARNTAWPSTPVAPGGRPKSASRHLSRLVMTRAAAVNRPGLQAAGIMLKRVAR